MLCVVGSGICGGAYANSIYTTATYLGCYADWISNNRDLSFSLTSTLSYMKTYMTNELCITACRSRGYTYSATQNQLVL